MLRNLLKLALNDRHLRPRVALYYVTGQCNLNCAYCEDFGARRNAQNDTPLPLEQVMAILRLIRSGVDALMLTGGEPLTHPDIDQILLRAKTELKFRELTLITNGLLLPQHETALPAVDRLIVSLDSTDPQLWSQTIGVSPAQAEAILTNISDYAKHQGKFGYQMIVNAVITPESLLDSKVWRLSNLSNLQNLEILESNIPEPPYALGDTFYDLLSFCAQHNLLLSFSPQSFNNWPRYELTVSPAYQALIQKLRQLKRAGAPILASDLYLGTLAAFQPYDCYPTLAPRIMPNGDLTYPCRPFEKADNGQGGRPVNLLNAKSWAEAWEIAYKTYGQPPRTCHSCFQQCYAEPSLMQANPLAWAWEWLRYPASRKGNLSTYAPG
ncbi:MAG: radical SAM protein [Chloroflexi bacterium]|nr:MAG: radical SAM protein [Chloroflexota bacterium]